MRIIIFSLTFFLLLMTSITNARTGNTQNETVPENKVNAPSVTLPSTHDLTGTVEAGISFDILTNEITLTNITPSSFPTITVIVTNPLPSGGGYTLLTAGWACETSNGPKEMYVCSTKIGSLSVDESATLRLDHELHLPTFECEYENDVSGAPASNRQLSPPDAQDVHRTPGACYVEILSPQAVASLSESSHFQLSLVEPLYNSVCGCGVLADPLLFYIYMPLLTK